MAGVLSRVMTGGRIKPPTVPTIPDEQAPYAPPAPDDQALLPNLEGGGEGELPIIPGGLGGGGGDTGGGGGPIDPPPPPIDAGGGDLPIDPPPLYGDDPIEPPTLHPTDPTGGGGELGPPVLGPVGGGVGPSDLKGSIYAKLMGLINRGPNNAATQHAQDIGRQMLAERNAAEGINDSGGADSRFLGLQQDIARNAQTDNDQMILQALGLGGNLYGSDLNRDLSASEFEQLQNSGLLQMILNALSQQGQGAV